MNIPESPPPEAPISNEQAKNALSFLKLWAFQRMKVGLDIKFILDGARYECHPKPTEFEGAWRVYGFSLSSWEAHYHESRVKEMVQQAEAIIVEVY